MATLAASVSASPAAAASWDDARDTAVHQELDRAVSPQPGGGHLTRLSALRALRDSRLRPLLVSLTEGGDTAVQVHALLGLAELAADGTFEASRLKTADPAAIEAAILVRMEARPIEASEIRHILNLPHLTTATQLRLLAALLAAGESVSVAEIDAIEVPAESPIAAQRAVLLAAAGNPEALTALATRIRASATDPGTLDAGSAALEYIRIVGDPSGAPLLTACTHEDMPVGIRRFALLTMLEQDAPGNIERFCAEAGRADRRREQVDLALLLLMTRHPVPPSCRPMFESDALLGVLADAADAQAMNSKTLAGSLVAGVKSSHRRTIHWLLDSMDERPDDLAATLIDQILDQAIAAELKHGTGAHGVEAAAQLLRRFPERFRHRLAAAEDDGTEQQLLLLALVQQPAPEMFDTVAELRRIGLGHADVLALLVLARDGETLSSVDVERLKLVAASSTASEAMRTQAAWLAVRHSGIVDDVMAALVKTVR